MKKVYIVGIGMDGNSTLTQQARAAIGSADCLIGAARMLEPFSALSKPCFTSWNSGEIAPGIFWIPDMISLRCSCPGTAAISAARRDF